MVEALVITPVKDSLQNTLETIQSIHKSEIEIEYIVYNDFSSEETKLALQKWSTKLPFKLINLEDLTNSPSPNYLLILKQAQQLALEKNIPLIIVESDVEIKPNTIGQLLQFSKKNENSGLIGAVTIDDFGNINYPYLKFKNNTNTVIETKRSISFCCTLLSINFLKSFDFNNLNQKKNWYDTIISK
ncbi:MAG: glycosyltransferase, partial [Bacteroidetes bacterium]|nr:glycosyltransferase [Bacteroidota bacterium]